jgi:hypothetical protein
MSFKKFVVLAGFVILVMFTTLFTFAQETITAPADSVVVTSEQQAVTPNENDTQWAWGEVTNVDNQAKSFTLKYLDYEADQEKELVINVDEKTTFENIQGFENIKIKDTLSIDYIVESGNKNIAKNISFEKPDSSSSASVQAIENTKAAESPSVAVEQPVEASGSIVQSEAASASAAVNDAPTEPAPVVQGQAQ